MIRSLCRQIKCQNACDYCFGQKFALEKYKESNLFSGVLDCAEDCILVSTFIEVWISLHF